MTQTDTQNGFAVSIGADNIEQQACLRRDAGSWREDNPVVWLQFVEAELIITHYGDLGTQFLYQMTQVIGE